ncbi:hypothetical protein [Burkholderia cenocepacia]|uniref:hypothetical protein n=1 Tax=Burkholderia cenocepacia TaxID=95486 RepID=UPI00076C9439|nr:hypothetical protein [Burkholderia cenocepacia]KWU17776.1 hypothetical protein AS149_13735 [Burkholderia cenocepacia]
MKTSLKTLVAGAVLAPALSFAAAPVSPLVGTWHSTGGAPRALAGTITLSANGDAQVAPQNFAPLNGTWKAEKGQLTLTMPPHGSSVMAYSIEHGKLTLTYDNQEKQTFEAEGKKGSKQ